MKFEQIGSGASEEKSFENVNGRKVITIAHPEHSSCELKIYVQTRKVCKKTNLS